MTILLRAATGALLGIAATYLIGDALSDFDHIAIIAPMGASAVLAFAVPASPLATPRAIILGNTLSAMIGVGISLLCGLPMGHFTRDDIHVALQKMPDPLDVDERDLTALITLAEEISATRRKKS
ncbi:HPP family protein [Novacetimonas hansenii]|uniref:HPP family protein n=1 Tax=Novacetimonas hansenii TaxID=436 RepID=UPI00248DF1C9|nr:HPP family protein [Novacetimonas hansenii]